MLARTSGGTRGSAPNCERGSVGASARIAYTTKLMTMIVGTAMKSRRRMYLPTYVVPRPSGRGGAVDVHRAAVIRRLSFGHLYQSWMPYLSEFQPVRVLPLTGILMPYLT